MAGDWLLWLATGLAVAGIAVLRASWARPARSAALNTAGWSALLASAVLAGSAAGAWGVTIAALVAMAAALMVLAAASFEQPRWRRRANGRAAAASIEDGRIRIAPRLATFFLTGPLALAVSLALALALRNLMLAGGGAESNGNVAVLALVPLLWPLLSFALLMTERRARQWQWLLALCGISLVIIWLSGRGA